MAASLAVIMHLLLFAAVRPADGIHSVDVRVPPKTYYRSAPSDAPLEDGVRLVGSPVLFSLPSPLGFSRDLMADKLSTPLVFSQPEETETYLSVDPAARTAGAQLVPENLMLTAGESTAPPPPIQVVHLAGKSPSARRVHVEPGLKERLEGGIVLPPALNRPEGAAWEVRAEVSVSREGMVQHVFIEKPLEEVALNQAVLHLLHGLRFRAGSTPIEGRVEIYSAFEEATP
jgi:hypothetical protein